MKFKHIVLYSVASLVIGAGLVHHVSAAEIHDAAAGNNIIKIQELIAAGVNVQEKDEEGRTALIWASMVSQNAAVEQLLQAGADLDATDDYGNTALILAMSYNHTETATRLLQAGADITIKNNEGQTALMAATDKGNGFTDVEMGHLLKPEAVDAKDNEGDTALMMLADAGNIEAITQLLQAGANVNAQNNKGQTVLMRAIEALQGEMNRPTINDATEIVKQLLQFGADINARNNDGQTALDLAQAQGIDGIIQVIENHIFNTRRGFTTKSATTKAP